MKASSAGSLTPELDELALVRAAVSGNRRAFAALVTPHLPDLSRLCLSLVGQTLADDCVQDALLLALLRLPSLRDPEVFGWWLRGIAIRVCRRALARVERHAPLPAEDDAGLSTWLPGPGAIPSLEDGLGTADLVRNVREAVAELPAGQRHAVELHYLRGLPYEAAAALLGIPVGALKTRLHKARAALARHFRLVDAPLPARLDDRALSVHEASHAVLGWLHGLRIDRIAITPRAREHLGMVQFSALPSAVSVGERLVATMAGEAGVALGISRRPRSDSGDRAVAAQIARAATGGDDVEAALCVADALTAARRRLEEPRVWAMVERVSGALIARRQLDGDELRGLVAR